MPGFLSCHHTHPGLVRDHNEDALRDRSDQALWVVADGMGGYGHGALAADMVVREFDAFAPADRLSVLVDQAERLILAAHVRLRVEATRHGLEMIGATVVVMLGFRDVMACLWAGDSRAYRWRRQRLDRLTTDHAVKGKVTRAVGASEGVAPDLTLAEALPGDRFVLCSDGLTGEVEEASMAAALAAPAIDGIAAGLIDRALLRGGRDNVSAIVVEVRR